MEEELENEAKDTNAESDEADGGGKQNREIGELEKIMEDFEQMKAVYAFHVSKSSDDQSIRIYPEHYNATQKRTLRRYAQKYELKGQSFSDFRSQCKKCCRTGKPLKNVDVDLQCIEIKINLPVEETIVKFMSGKLHRNEPLRNTENELLASKDGKEKHKEHLKEERVPEDHSSSESEFATINLKTWKDVIKHFENTSNQAKDDHENNEGDKKILNDIMDSQSDTEILTETKAGSFISVSQPELVCLEDEEMGTFLEPQNVSHQIKLSSKQIVDTIWSGCNVGYVESKIDNVNISDNRLIELRGEQYLSDEIIDAYLIVLSRTLQGVKIQIEEYDIVMGGYHGNNCHWNLIVLKPLNGTLFFLNPLGETRQEIDKITKNWRTFWRNRVKNLNSLEIEWQFVPIAHPKQKDSYNCGIFVLKFAECLMKEDGVNFAHSKEEMQRYRREIAETLIESSNTDVPSWCRVCGRYNGDNETLSCATCFRWIHVCCKGKTEDGHVFECASCIAALVKETERSEKIPPPSSQMQSTPSRERDPNNHDMKGKANQEEKSEQERNAKPTAKEVKGTAKKPPREHNLKMLKTSSKTRASRCETCKADFKEKGTARQRFHIGHYGPRPFFRKATNSWHHGTRNYYYCVRKDYFLSVKGDICGKDIDISEVRNEFLKSDIVLFKHNGLDIDT
eukprot:gene11664-12869_t